MASGLAAALALDPDDVERELAERSGADAARRARHTHALRLLTVAGLALWCKVPVIRVSGNRQTPRQQPILHFAPAEAREA